MPAEGWLQARRERRRGLQGMPVEGWLQARRERRCGLRVPRVVIEANVNIVGKAEST
jgi:hypothetical protein